MDDLSAKVNYSDGRIREFLYVVPNMKVVVRDMRAELDADPAAQSAVIYRGRARVATLRRRKQ